MSTSCTLFCRLAFPCLGIVAAGLRAEPVAFETVRTVGEARVLEVSALRSVEADVVVLGAGLLEGWREGVRGVIRRGSLEVATVTVVASSERTAAALIDSLATDVRIGAGDTAIVKLQSNQN